MTDDPALLAAVIDRPADDAPRLVYADWLDEHGQSDRAEFVRVQVRLADTPTWDPARPALERREADLLGEHQLDWIAPLLDAGARGWTFDRGFPDRVVLNTADFLRYGMELLDRTTVRTVSPFDAQNWRALLAHPAARRLAGLVLGHLPDADAAANLLAGTPAFAGLRSLTLEVTDTGLARLARAEHLGGLTALRVGSNDVTTAGLRALANATFAESLRLLGVLATSASPDGFVELAAGPRWRNLATLELDGNDLRAGHLRRLVSRARLDALTTLSIKDVGLDDDPRDLAAVLALPRLARLHLGPDAVTAAVRALLDAPAVGRYAGVVLDTAPRPDREHEPAADRLEVRLHANKADVNAWLAVTGHTGPEVTATLVGPGTDQAVRPGPWPALPPYTPLGIDLAGPVQPVGHVHLTGYVPKAGGNRLIQPPFVPALRAAGSNGPRYARRGCDAWEAWPEAWRAYLSGPLARALDLKAVARLSDADLWELAGLPALARIRDLDLAHGRFSLSAVRALLESPHLTGLRRLRLTFNELGDDLAELVAGSPALGGLVSLKLSFCGIGDRGAMALAASPYLTRLTTLKLWGGRGGSIRDDGAAAIARSPTLARLMGLRLRDNQIGDAGALALAASPYLNWMRELDIADNPIGPEGMQALEERFPDRLGRCSGDAEPLPE